jgi:spore coat polysaccharide biosynthesis protein SpsF
MTVPRVVASIEARLGSSRLPGKVLTDIGGVPALTRLLRRLRRCRTIHDIVLATSMSPADDALEAWARDAGLAVYRGSEDDVLDRVVCAQRQMASDLVVEITGDCPLLDPQVVDLGVETFLVNACDVVTNVRIPSFPQGIDVQVFRRADLEHVAATVDDPAVREHVSLFFYEHPDRYRTIHLLATEAWRDPDQRLQLDYAEDLALIRAVYARLEPTYGDGFGIAQILALLAHEPALATINAHCVEKPVR